MAFAETPGGTCAYEKLLCRTPFVATINNSTANLHLLETHDFLSKLENCVVLWLKEPPLEHSDDDSDGIAAPGPMLPAVCDGSVASSLVPCWHKWSVARLGASLKAKDMHAAARCCQANDVSGKDFATLTEQGLVGELGMSLLSAKKLLHTRAEMHN